MCADTRPEHLQPKKRPRARSLLDDVIGAGKEGRRHSEAQCLCGLQVDDELEFSRLLEGKIGRIGTLEDSVHVTCRFAEIVSKVHTVGHEGSEFSHLSV